MPKTKSVEKKVSKPVEEEKILEVDMEEKILDPETILGEETEEELEEDSMLDDDEVDPFKDKWEE